MTDETLISFKELQKKYQLLLAENRLLKAELNAFKAGLSVTEIQRQGEPCLSCEPENIIQQFATELPSSSISNRSKSTEKIRLFMSLFKGREDVYAKRWDSKKMGAAGYSPVCLNEWKRGVTDQKIVWYGSINLLSFGSAEESIMRLQSSAIANELMKTVYNSVAPP